MSIEEIMIFNTPYNQRNIDELIDKIKINCVVPYIGAGMSISFADIYPSWSEFLYNTFNEFVELSEKDKFEKLDYEDKAKFLYDNIGKITLSSHLKETFGQKHLEKDPLCFKDKPAFLLPIIFKEGLLITTNYDKVIEKSYALHCKPISVAHPGHFEALNESLRNKDLLLYKIHGDISEPIESIVLTKEQYDNAYENKDLINALNQIYISRDILFLGCSLSKDRPIQFLCDISRSGMSNFAVVPCEKSLVNTRRTELENDYFTKSIIYPEGQHECLNEILKYITEAVNPKGYSELSSNILLESKMELEDEWFTNQNAVQIKNLGDRYLPDLNVTPSINNIFDGLSRNDKVYERIKKKTDELLSCLNELKMSKIQEKVDYITDIIKAFSIDSVEAIEIDNIVANLEMIDKIIESEIRECYDEIKKLKQSNNNIEGKIFYLREARAQIEYYSTYISSKEIQAINVPFVFLYGEGGIGKSHLIADVIKQRNVQGKKSLLFLGQHFKKDNPITEILNALEVACTSEEFFEMLNKKGETENSRIILFIDALNEGNGKEIWNEYLAGVVEVIGRYPWIGLVVSIRTEYVEKLFEDKSLLKSKFISIKHSGFFEIEYEAIKKYFAHYGITCFDISFAEQEFRNPLFIRLFCEGFKNKTVNLEKINFSDIYSNYIETINKKIANECKFSRRINIVKQVINNLLLFKHNQNSRNNFIPLEDAIRIIIDIEKKYNIQESLLDELISNGILTQNIGHDNQEYIYVTYEKLDDYLYGKLLVGELYKVGIDEFRIKHSELIYYEDLLEAMAIALSEDDKYELYEIFPGNNSSIMNAFCHALKWRKSKKLKAEVIVYIHGTILKTQNGFKTLFEELILLSSQIDHDLNAEQTVNFIMKHEMSDRDKIFIPMFDELFNEEDSVIQRLLNWCLFNAEQGRILDETIELTAIMLATFLISSNNYLRDRTTKALIKLLTGKIDILILVLEKYENIDDPYVIERLYAVAFGCVVSEEDNAQVEKLALFVYSKIYKTEYVYPNILLRDYAKNIIEYAKYKVKSKCLEKINIQPPFKSKFPEVPTDEEISEYKYDYNAPNFKDYYWGQNMIISSMRVEYSRDGRSGGYGDFGRYVFQSYFSDWGELNSNDLCNIAIKKIFDMGYNAEKHGAYDRSVKNRRGNHQKHERIGKKYQWIALYTLAAEVADNYLMKVYTDMYGCTKNTYCIGSFEPNIRNIDPTISVLKREQIESSKRTIHDALYSIPIQDNHTWLADFKDLPDIKKMLQSEHSHREYLLLNGWYSWSDEKELGKKTYQNPTKDIWVQINSYIICKDQCKKFINALANVDLMGRWAAEPSDNYQLFNKEYYWSAGYNFFQNPYYGGEEWVDFGRNSDKLKTLGLVLIPTFRYLSERSSDTNDNDNASWYKPCGEIFNFLQLMYGKENTVLYDKNGNIVCFDSKELLQEKIGFFINTKDFENFLNNHGYSVFWTILAEKRILQDSLSNHKMEYPMSHISGLVYYDSKGNLISKINQFDD